MPKSTITFDTVREIGLTLPGVKGADGALAIRAQGKLLAWVPKNRSAEPASIALSIDSEDRAELIAAEPEIYYVTDHYAGYDTVLVRLSRIDRDALRDLLGLAHKFVTRKPRPVRRRVT